MNNLVISLWVFGTAILISGLFLSAGIFWLRATGKISASLAFRWSVVITTITVGGFLVIAGYGQTQVAPIFSLLGTVIGYVLGYSQKVRQAEVVTPPPPAPPQS